jgi:phenylacetate-CoA ligase
VTDTLTPTDRYPWLTDDSRRLLDWLHEHPSAPRFNHQCGDRLTAAGLERVREFERLVSTAPPGWQPGQPPAWLAEFARSCFSDVPFYRRYGAMPARLEDTPTCTRADLSREPWSFVPDSAPLDDLIVYNTSGTTGHPLDVLSHPEAASKYLPLLNAALRLHGLALAGGRDPASGQPGVALILVCCQRRTYTYASVSAYLGGAGFAKINLSPHEWRRPDDRARFLDDCRPAIITGDPISFAELARLPLRHHPQALISTAMQLLPGLRQELEARFGCPVIDLYAMNEAGPIAAATPTSFALLQPRLYVEVLDEDGQQCAPGQRGEITLSGGFNPFIPLLRYRTGDFASLSFSGRQPLIVGLEGRPPVVFRGAAGQSINNIDVTGALKAFALPCYQLHQSADGALRLSVPPADLEAEPLRAALLRLFGPDQALEIVVQAPPAGPGGKFTQYTRDDDDAR